MSRKNVKSIAAVAMSAAMVMAMGTPAFAAATYTPVAGTSCNFNKYLIMDAGDNVPNATFSFTVAPGAARSADTSDNAVMQVLPGVGTPTIADVTFGPSDATATAAGSNIDVARAASARASGLTAATGVELEAGEKYATKQATVSFAGITFPEPGIYRYVITETANATHEAAGIMHDNDVDRILDVYVTHSDTAVAGTAGTEAVPDRWLYAGSYYEDELDANNSRESDIRAAESQASEFAQRMVDENPDSNYDEWYPSYLESLMEDIDDVTFVPGTAAVPGASAQPGLVVSAYVLHTDDDDVVINTSMGSADVAAAGAALDDKTDGFTNEYNSKDLVFKKEVTGNQASRDKWFEFTATAADVNDSDVFTVSLADDNDANTTDGNADATSGTTEATRASNRNKTNPTSVTGAQLKAGVKFYLQHGQSIAIRGFAPNATYTVTEDAEDYKKTESAVAGHTDPTTGVIGTVAETNKVVKTSFQNQRDGIIPTGILMTVAPFAALTLCGGIGAATIVMKGRKKEEDEE